MTVSPERIGIAVVGLGVGTQHARAYHKVGSCQIRWLYDLDAAKAKQLSAELGEGEVAYKLEQILQDSQVKVVSIASYDDAHFDQIIQALQAGKHVFVEKPLCQTQEQLRKIKALWAASHGELKLFSNLVLRAAPVYIWLKERIQEGDFGEVYSYDGDYLYGRLHKITEGWRKDVQNYSVTVGGGIHLIDLMIWLTGQRPRTVSAIGNRISTEGTAFRYLDYVTAMMQSGSGMAARITTNYGCTHRHQHVVRVFGTKGTFIYDDTGARLHRTREPAVLPDSLSMPTLPATKGDLIPAFVSAVINGEDLNAETQSFFDGISIGIACDRAVTSHRWEEIEYV